jgi:hypothetical protein
MPRADMPRCEGRADPPAEVFLKVMDPIDAHGAADGRAASRRSQTKRFM